LLPAKGADANAKHKRGKTRYVSHWMNTTSKDNSKFMLFILLLRAYLPSETLIGSSKIICRA